METDSKTKLVKTTSLDYALYTTALISLDHLRKEYQQDYAECVTLGLTDNALFWQNRLAEIASTVTGLENGHLEVVEVAQ